MTQLSLLAPDFIVIVALWGCGEGGILHVPEKNPNLDLVRIF